ncbi:hypothetical protein TSTA_014260 [Talaromyces stipitatus ATCC 10500]|uniref:Amidohydrolase-related domain-containing protein n=1 Tax=Talaromyces stipitatus (strain ATCC 10500 / CBS 375.48 / QM 6759 / NRRL 1006) TaxID=441959 RepID=B8MGV4_TALSN|nr:uncharacterized protein TSTA_014260 [Talaromyces stipitatus ATCC 10500]EED16335.1 hypothetical protein TSTA_014260 [Talaromyces stipitatus ATCC 10500]
MPAFDWSHETALGRLRQFPDVKIVCSHDLVALVKRGTMISLPEFGSLIRSQEVLSIVPGFAKEGHVLLGSDFPHATVPFSQSFTKFIDVYNMDDAMRKNIYFGAAEELFPRLNGTFA